ncbi:hypothetical protein SISNIDRAFT_484510 [Sistotremastrum niveocremeum HHB9708]|uniref:F-box domain-containing protein n=1 Tax=Sistotremastrum niveocremeum HHB9708 TaxID=1314777 RepID=A0A164WF11_9AGAM|nr:hypothetical protein SISNIDRAFT_484510 [Sistotremastrum niveocremeum HHB9708]
MSAITRIPAALKIPAEIVTIIQRHLISTDDLQALADPKYSNTWRCLGSICASWRVIALGDPYLWSHVHLVWPEHVVMLCLKRSGTSPLSLGIDKDSFYSGNFVQMIGVITSALPRITHLDIEWRRYDQPNGNLVLDDRQVPSEVWAWITRLLSRESPATSLSRLRFQFFNRDLHEPLNVGTLRHLPKLSDFYCRSLVLNLALLKPCLLTKVDIGIRGLTSQDIISFLALAPLLEHVKFFHPHQHDRLDLSQFESDGDPPFRIQLEHLKTFQAGWCLDVFAEHVIRSISFPPSAKITLRISRPDMAPVMEIFFSSSHFETTLRSSVSLSIIVEWFQRDKLLSGHPFLFKLTLPDGIHHRIEIDEWDSSYTYGRIQEAHSMFLALASLGPLPQLRQIFISSRTLPWATSLNTLLNNLPAIEEIAVRTRDATSFIAALGSRKSPRPPCPSLRKLDLRGSKFDPRQLRDIIVERGDSNYRLEELYVSIDQQRLRLSNPDPVTLSAAIRNLRSITDQYEETDEYWTSSSEEEDE